MKATKNPTINITISIPLSRIPEVFREYHSSYLSDSKI
jgi:hypothetical protein